MRLEKLKIVKTHFSKLKRLTLATAVAGVCTLRAATLDTYVISGPFTFPDPIDATNVVVTASGDVQVATTAPYDTSNTRNFTNSGSMQGSVGFQFDTAPRNSGGALIAPRRLASNFHNKNTGVISALDGFLQNGNIGSYLFVHATNIVNQGILNVGGGGWLKIVGTNVNLSRSGVGVEAISPTGSFNDFPFVGSFYPDTAIYDNWWGQTNDTYNISGIVNFFGPLLYAVSPVHRVSNGGASGNVQVFVQDPVMDAYSAVVGGVTLSITNQTGATTNVFYPTNIVRQAAFVGSSDPTNFTVSIRWAPSTIPTNDFRTVAVELLVGTTNAITAQSEFNSLYFVDYLASENNRGLLTNYLFGTYRPTNYLVSRLQVQEFFSGQPGNDFITNNYFWNTNYGSRFSTGPYAGYSAFVDNLQSRPPVIPSATVTNLPGRLDINADSLDLTKARMRAEGLMSIKARHLVGSSNAVVDGENLSFYLGSTNGNLRIQDLLRESVERMKGDIYAWSGFWTNAYTTIITNYAVDTNGATLALITNVTLVGNHCLILDATALLNTIPVTIYDLQARGTNIYVSPNDHGMVAQSFYLDGDSFTLDGAITFSNVLQTWVYTNAPKLKYFTNNGTLTIPTEAHFGDDGPNHYVVFRNRGTISSGAQTIRSDYCELGGTNFAGTFTMMAGDAKVENGRVAATGEATFQSGTLKFNRALVDTPAQLTFGVSGALYDNGGSSSNTITCGDGFVMNSKPTLGDLLGTTLRTVVPSFAAVSHTWAATDLGATRAGFSNNVAIGRLVLIASGADPFFMFSGAGAGKALYVDYLDLSQLTDYESQLYIDSGFVIYYAAAKLGFTPPDGLTPEEYLDGRFGGQLRWVKSFAGPNSSVDVAINGNQTVKMNKALRNSTTIDSDADGIPNYFDLTPLGGVTLTGIQRSSSPAGYRISWQSAAGTTYRVEYRDSATTGAWQLLTTATNAGVANAELSVVDTNVPAGTQRYYRITYNPNGP